MFQCDKCGLCCMRISDLPPSLGEDLNRGDGVCRYFDDESHLCTIYDSRPLFCNVERTYNEMFASSMSKEEYYGLNYASCKRIKEEYGGEECI